MEPSENENELVGLPSRIGLSLSGGGYRAAAFHLGVLSYLDRVGFLQRVVALSTVSGGTITGARYVVSLLAGVDFTAFFHRYYDELKRSNLLIDSLTKLADVVPATLSTRNTAVVALAESYLDTYFRDERNEPILFGRILDDDAMHLKDVVFNATEFRYGIAFRFQKSVDLQAKIGNGRVSITRDDARQIRLADIVAASSCFPGGMEPIMFPDDFHWPSGSPSVYDSRSKTRVSVALMDGGVYDNQGLESVLLADDRADDDLDLLVISDVNAEVDDFYPVPKRVPRGKLRVWVVATATWVFMIVALITVIVSATRLVQIGKAFTMVDFFLHVVPLILATATAFVIWWIRHKIKQSVLPSIPQYGARAWSQIRRLKVDDVIEMIRLRLTSLQAMAGGVFMKRIRSLTYKTAYGKDRYRDKLLSNLIYQLTTGKKLSLPDGVPDASVKLRAVVDRAADMPTTLWFDDPGELPDLVAAGQATICYNLMKHLKRKTGAHETSSDLREMQAGLANDWVAMNTNPRVFLPSEDAT